jgi:predicted RND superfamily exporter protein
MGPVRHNFFWDRAARFLIRYSIPVCLVSLLLTVVFLFQVFKLEIRTDFKELLPEKTQSVKDLNRIMDRVGGLGTLSIAIESPDREANIRFVEDLVKNLYSDLGDRIRYVDHSMKPIRDFVSRHIFLYMDLEDLNKVVDEVDQARKRALIRLSPFSFELDPEAERKTFRVPDLKESKARGRLEEYPGGYYANPEQTFFAVLIRPKVNVTGIEGNRQFLADTQRLIDRMNPAGYHPQMKIGYAGSVKITLDEYDRIKDDLLGTALLCIGLICLAVFLYFPRVRVILLLGGTLIMAVIWTFGITHLAIGFVTAQTAFLGAIIAGTGINYGIILLARYLEERNRGLQMEEALPLALNTTFHATLAASVTTAVSFAALFAAHIRAFSQFGFIGGVGVILCWLFTFTFLPSLLSLTEKIRPLSRGFLQARPSRLFSLPSLVARPLLRHARPALVILLLLAVFGGVLYARFLPGSLDYNLNNLRNKSSLHSGTAQLDDRINHVLHFSTSPAIILARDQEQAREICQVMLRRWEGRDEQRPFKDCRSIYSLLPENQEAKLPLIAKIQKNLKLARELAPENEIPKITDVLKRLDARPLDLPDLPAEMTRHFTEKDGTRGRFAFVNPAAGKNLWQAENLFSFTDAIREHTLPTGEKITSSGEAVVFADIIRDIKRDGPLTSILALLGVIISVILILGGIRSAIFVISGLVAGVLWMFGLQALLGIKFNFFNFIALPLTFGIAVDYSINFFQRYRMEGPGHVIHALETTGGAVFLCSLTTIIGYAVLIIADNQALASFGFLAIVGEITGIFSALFFLPVLLQIMENRKSKKGS